MEMAFTPTSTILKRTKPNIETSQPKKKLVWNVLIVDTVECENKGKTTYPNRD